MRLLLACLCERALLRGNTVDLNSIAAQIITDRLPCDLSTTEYKPKSVLVWVDVTRSFSPRAVLHNPMGGTKEFDLPRVSSDTDTVIQSLELGGITVEHEGVHKLHFLVDDAVMGSLTFKVISTRKDSQAIYA